MANNLTIFSPKRALLFAFDASSLVVFALITLACFPSVALAYVDPSVMTYTIQALAGVAVALSAVLGVAMRRTRKALVKFLGIDENARKEKDELMHALDNKGNPIIEPWEYELLSTQAQAGKAAQKGAKARGTRKAQTAANSPASTSASAVGSASASTSASATGATAANLSTKSPADAPSWRRRLVLSFIVVGFCGFTLGIVAPFEIVAGNSASLVVGLSDIWLPLTLLTLAGVVVFSLLLSIVRGRAFTPALVFIFCCGLCCWVQAMFLNTGLPSANGDTVNFWQDHAPMMIISAIVWALLLIAPAIISGFHRARAQGACACLALCLILVQGVGVASLALSPEANQSGSSIIEVTEDGLYEVSDKSNVVVFILDRFETAFFDDLYAQDPNLLEGFDGFTYYRDSVGVMEPTWNALPYLLTRYEAKWLFSGALYR